MAFYKQSTAYTREFKMIDSADHFSKKTGLTCTVNISKAGAAFGAAGGTVTEIANGWYKIALTTTDTNTVGDLAFYITATGADDTDFVDQIWVRDLADLAFPATSGRSMVVDASGLVDANAVKVGPTGSGTAQTARDIGASVLLSTGTGTGQLDFTSGVVKGNVTQVLGTAASTPATAGILEVNVKNWNNLAAVALPLVPTTAGRTLDVSAGGEAGLDWANIGSPTTSVNLSGTTVGVAAALTANNDKTGYGLSTNETWIVDNGTAQGGGASTITLRAGASATDNLYRAQRVVIKSGTGAGQTRIITAYVGSTQVATVDEAWQTAPDNTSTYVVQADRAPKLDSSLQVVAASVTGAVGSVTGNVGGNVTGSVGSVVGAVGSVTGNVGGSVASVVGAVGSVTGNVGGNVTGSVGSLAAQAKADALAQVNAALDAAMTELTGDAGATPTLRQAAQMLYMAVRNKTDQTATTQQVYNSAGSVILTAACSDDGTTATRGKYA